MFTQAKQQHTYINLLVAPSLGLAGLSDSVSAAVVVVATADVSFSKTKQQICALS